MAHLRPLAHKAGARGGDAEEVLRRMFVWFGKLGVRICVCSVLVYVCARECVAVCRCSCVFRSPTVWSHAVVVFLAVPVGGVSANVTQCLDWGCPIQEWILLFETHPNDPASHQDRYT